MGLPVQLLIGHREKSHQFCDPQSSVWGMKKKKRIIPKMIVRPREAHMSQFCDLLKSVLGVVGRGGSI